MIQNFVSLSTWFMFFLFVEHLGERSLAIANIIRNVSGIPFMIAMAFASTCGSLVSNLIGAGEQDCVRGTIKQHIRIGYVFVIPILIFFCLFPDLVLRIYTDMPDLREASIPSLWVLCSAYLVLVPANVYFQSVSGTGNTRTALAMELCVLAIYVTYCNLFYYVPANGHRICLDNRKCIRHFYTNVLLQVSEERKLAEKEDLNPFFIIFARK